MLEHQHNRILGAIEKGVGYSGVHFCELRNLVWGYEFHAALDFVEKLRQKVSVVDDVRMYVVASEIVRGIDSYMESDHNPVLEDQEIGAVTGIMISILEKTSYLSQDNVFLTVATAIIDYGKYLPVWKRAFKYLEEESKEKASLFNEMQGILERQRRKEK